VLGLLIAQLDNDDRSFIINLYKNYYNLARKVILSLTHNSNDLEDLINDVFIKLIDKISIIRNFESCKITVYIVYTVRSVAINYLKHKNVENKYIFYSDNIENEEVINDEYELSRNIVSQEEIKLLRDSISKLPQNQKDILYFKYVLELSDIEIAETLNIAPNSVREYLTRARRSAKKLMEKELSSDVK